MDLENKPLAVILIGEAHYLTDPCIQPWMMRLYSQIQQILEDKGYSVSFDEGQLGTIPNRLAAVWVGHDAGGYRLRFAPSNVVRVRLRTQSWGQEFPSEDLRRRNEQHYLLSNWDAAQLQAIPNAPTA